MHSYFHGTPHVGSRQGRPRRVLMVNRARLPEGTASTSFLCCTTAVGAPCALMLMFLDLSDRMRRHVWSILIVMIIIASIIILARSWALYQKCTGYSGVPCFGGGRRPPRELGSTDLDPAIADAAGAGGSSRSLPGVPGSPSSSVASGGRSRGPSQWDATCVICARGMAEQCATCVGGATPQVFGAGSSCVITKGKCGHEYHLHCLCLKFRAHFARHQGTPPKCPMDGRYFDFKYEDHAQAATLWLKAARRAASVPLILPRSRHAALPRSPKSPPRGAGGGGLPHSPGSPLGPHHKRGSHSAAVVPVGGWGGGLRRDASNDPTRSAGAAAFGNSYAVPFDDAASASGIVSRRGGMADVWPETTAGGGPVSASSFYQSRPQQLHDPQQLSREAHSLSARLHLPPMLRSRVPWYSNVPSPASPSGVVLPEEMLPDGSPSASAAPAHPRPRLSWTEADDSSTAISVPQSHGRRRAPAAMEAAVAADPLWSPAAAAEVDRARGTHPSGSRSRAGSGRGRSTGDRSGSGSANNMTARARGGPPSPSSPGASSYKRSRPRGRGASGSSGTGGGEEGVKSSAPASGSSPPSRKLGRKGQSLSIAVPKHDDASDDSSRGGVHRGHAERDDLPGPPAASAESPSVEEVVRLQREIEEIREQRMCPVCLANAKDMAFGCGHQCCATCADLLAECPICRKAIETRIRLYG